VQKALAQNDPRLAEVVARLARTVLDQTDALARIAADFRQFAGAPKRNVERLRASVLLEDVQAHYAGVVAAGEAELEVVATAGDAEFDADRQELRRVFQNLIDNALEAGGRRVRLDATREAGQVAFRIADDGPGVSADARARLFEPYFTTKSAGTGLGLAICRKVVQAHGGTIELETSAPGRTVFRVGVPLAGGAA
jgi:signal transduction histidine kinase